MRLFFKEVVVPARMLFIVFFFPSKFSITQSKNIERLSFQTVFYEPSFLK